MINKLKKKGALAISQILILIVGLFAIMFFIGSANPVLAAEGECPDICASPIYSLQNGQIVDGKCKYTEVFCSEGCDSATGRCEIKTEETSTEPESTTGSTEQDTNTQTVTPDRTENTETPTGSAEQDTGSATGNKRAVGSACLGDYECGTEHCEYSGGLSGTCQWESSGEGGFNLGGFGDTLATSFATVAGTRGATWIFSKTGATAATTTAAETATGATAGGEIVKTLPGKGIGGGSFSTFATSTFGAILIGAAVGVAVGFATKFIAQAAGASKSQANVLALSAGTAAGGTTTLLLIGGSAGAFWWTAPLAGILILAFYKKESTEVVAYQCLPWLPAANGDNCELCNGNEVPCSEYQCKSLGNCELVNEGEGGEELCVSGCRGELTAPVISTLDSALPFDFEYEPLPISFPTDRGVEVTHNGGCLPTFTDFELGIQTDKPARCKYSFTEQPDFESMKYPFGSSLYKQNFTMSLFYPDRETLEGENATYEEGMNTLFVRCEDKCGNSNVASFAFKFCIEEGADMVEPKVIGATPADDSSVIFDTNSLEMNLYLNKPSECGWSPIDTTFGDMNSTNPMTCGEEPTGFRGKIAYECSTTLNGIQNYNENKFYFRCKSFPDREESLRVEMQDAYEYNLFGTEPLEIVEIRPNDETIREATDFVEVEFFAKTAGGAKEGSSWCYYTDKENPENDDIAYKLFNVDGWEFKPTHTSILSLPEDDYSYHVRCCDDAYNCDTEIINFTVETDNDSPVVARAFYRDNKMNLVTDEPAECVFSTRSCEYSFTDGSKITSADELTHVLPWDTQTTLYVKCKDEYENQPSVASCSIIVRAYEGEEKL